MPDFARLGIAVDSRSAKTASTDLGHLAREGRKASDSADGLTRATNRTRDAQGRLVDQTRKATKAVSGMDSAFGGLIRRMALAAGAYAGVSKVSAAAEAYNKMTNSLRAMGIEAGQTAGMIDRISEIANRTRTPLEATAQLYQRISIAGRDLGASQQEVLRFTENVGLALAQTGSSASESSGALLQLSQAMAGGTVRAEEFNSILEGAFPIAQAAADGIDAAGGSVGRLRQLVVDGKVSSDEFFNAILSQTDQLEEAFGNTEATMSQAFTVLGNNLTTFVGEMDAATGASSAVADVILLLANNLDSVAGIAIAAGVAVAGAYAPAITGAVTATYAWVTSLVTLRGALMATGIGALVVGAGLLIGWFIKLVRATGGWGEALSLLGEVASGVWEGIKTSASSIAPALGAVWQTVKSAFYALLETMTEAWARFLGGLGADLAGVPVLDYFSQKLLTASGQAVAELSEFNAKAQGAASAADRLRQEASDLASTGFDAARAAAAKLAAQVEGTTDATLDSEDASSALKSALDKVSKAAGKAAKGLKKVKTESEAFAEAMEKAAYTTEDFGTEKANTLISGIDGISGAWGDFVSRGFSDFKGFVDNILDSFKGMLSQMITMAARNRIMIGLGFGGVTGSAASASGLAGSSGGSGGGLLGGGGNLLSLGSSLFGTGGAVSGVWSGLSGVFSGGGLGSSFANLGGLVSGSSGFAGGAVGAALPALGIIAVGIAAIASAFKNEYHGRAVRGALGPDGFDGYEFDFWDGGWLRGDTQRNYETGSELQSMLDDSSRAIRTNVEDMAAALGLGADAIADFTGEGFTIWLSGPSAGSQEQIAAALEAQLSALGEGMADLVLSTEAYTRSGESSYETMTRLGSSLITVNDAMDLLQVTAFNTSLAAADQASRLIDTFGGIEAMGSSILVYWNAFYSEAERQETIIRRLKDQFAGLNLTMPETREEFRALVNGLDLSSESGAALYVELIGLSGAMDQVLPQLGQLSETMTGLLSQINGELGSQVDIARGLANDSKQAASLWYRTATTLRDFLSGLLNSDLTSASHSQAHAVNRSRFDAAFGLARGGDVEAARDIPELAKAYLTSAQANASSSLEYRRIAAAVQGQVNFLAGISELEGANEDVLTGLYNQQIDVLTNLGNFLQLEGLTNDQVGELSAGVQALHADWDGTVGAFQSSLGALQDAITNAEAFSYDDLVGRLDVAVSLSDDAPSWVQRLVDRADTGIRTALDFVIRRNDLSAADRWIATNALSEHVASIDFVLRNDVDEDTRRLALRTDARIRRSIRLSLGRDLDQDTRTLVLTRAANLSRRVNVALTNGGDRTVRRLNRLQDLIGGSGSGNLTFDGGVQLTADSVFTDLVGSASGLVQPMDHLSNMLGELRQAVDSDRQQRELAALEAQGAALAANLAAKQVDASGIIDSIHALERATGTTLQNGGGDAVLRQLDGGGIAYRASHISSNHNVAAWQAQFWDDGGLEDQIFAVNAAIQGDREALRAWRRQIREAGGIPSYAGGGEQRRTGLAHIGENDLELVAPSRIYNPAETKAMLDNRELVKEIKALREEVSELRKDKHRTDYQKIKDQKESTGILRRMQVDGIKTKEAT